MNKRIKIILISLFLLTPFLNYTAQPETPKKTSPSPAKTKPATPPKTEAKTQTKPAPAPAKKTIVLPTALKDASVKSIVSKATGGTLSLSVLGSLYSDILQKIQKLIKGDVKVTEVDQTPLPVEFKPWEAVSLSGQITFLGEPADAKIIIGKLTDGTGKSKLGFSLDIGLKKKFTVMQLYKDFDFLSVLGVPGGDINKFGNIELPTPRIIFSTFTSYTHPESKAAVEAGLTIQTRTQVAPLMKEVRAQVNRMSGGNANKLPFLAKVNDNAAVAFGITIGFTGKTFQSFSANIALPMEIGVDFAKIRAEERNFKPGIKAPFADLNKPIKAVTGILNQAPLNAIKDLSVGNFIASLRVEKQDFKVSFGAELNVTTNKDVRYGILGTVALTTKELSLELRKSPSIKSMPLGGGVSIENIAVAVFAEYKAMAAGLPISGFGILGEISFPFEGDKVTIAMGGQVKAGGGFMMMGSVKNLDTAKIAVFNAQLIENLARKVNFDTSALTQGMKQLPTMKINDGFVYFATDDVRLGGMIFPKGLGVNLDVLIDKQKAQLAVAGNEKNLSFLGYLSTMKFPSNNPIVIITGSGPDKKYGNTDDGPFINFALSADKPLKTSFDMSGKIELPPVKVGGQGDVSLGLGRIGAKFGSKIADLFSAQFEVAFDLQKVLDAKIAFDLSAQERKNFLGVAFKQLEKEIVKAQKGAAKILLEPLRALAEQLGKGLDALNIGMPRKIAASLVARTFSGSMEIDGGSLTLPVIGEIKLGIPKVDFSLKDPIKAIGTIAEKWANTIVNEMKIVGEKIKEFAEAVGKGVVTAGEETGKFVVKTGETIGKETKKAAEAVGKEVSGWFTTKEKKVTILTAEELERSFNQLGVEAFYRKYPQFAWRRKIVGNKNPWTKFDKEQVYGKAIPIDEAIKSMQGIKENLLLRIEVLKQEIKDAPSQFEQAGTDAKRKQIYDTLFFQHGQLRQAIISFYQELERIPGIYKTSQPEKLKEFPRPIPLNWDEQIKTDIEKLKIMKDNWGKSKEELAKIRPVKEVRADLIKQKNEVDQAIKKYREDTAAAIKELKTLKKSDANKINALYKKIVEEEYPAAIKYKEFNTNLEKAIAQYGREISNVISKIEPDRKEETPAWLPQPPSYPPLEKHLEEFKAEVEKARKRT